MRLESSCLQALTIAPLGLGLGSFNDEGHEQHDGVIWCHSARTNFQARQSRLQTGRHCQTGRRANQSVSSSPIVVTTAGQSCPANRRLGMAGQMSVIPASYYATNGGSKLSYFHLFVYQAIYSFANL
ncbi:unnamed protein product [Protopolystoma xenopodis]|uniref:Uncharacterized protein n=1 Tax=Protopolystoma xenopodis TaxID=117903 RepID=A0A3S5CCN2_9PLAT|nr:unnamed protein product [Protopolystoma xenopodis]